MHCNGILSIIWSTKEDTYIDGFDKAGMLTYILYFHEIAGNESQYLFIYFEQLKNILYWILLTADWMVTT